MKRIALLLAVIALTGCTASAPEKKQIQFARSTECVDTGMFRQCSEQTLKVWVE